MKAAAGLLWSCRTMTSPCNQWAGEKKESKRILVCHCLTFTVHTVYLNRARGENGIYFYWQSAGKTKRKIS